MSALPQISVVITVYNVQDYLEHCLDSILKQTFTNIEVIAVDDGSTDASSEILKRYALSDSRLKVIRQENMGPGVSRNVGLDAAVGYYAIMLDADDYFEPDFLQKLYASAKANDADIVVCRATAVEDDGKSEPMEWTIKAEQLPAKKPVFSCEDMPDYVFTCFIGWPWDKLYKRDFLEQHALRFPALRNSEDLVPIFLSLALAKRICVVNEYLIYHRVNRAGSVSASRAANPHSFYEAVCILKKELFTREWPHAAPASCASQEPHAAPASCAPKAPHAAPASCAPKAPHELKKPSELYLHVSWGFLNWAFGYMLWNISSMSDPEARKAMLVAFYHGEYKEIEYRFHSLQFFSLTSWDMQLYHDLMSEAKRYILKSGEANATKDDDEHESLATKFKNSVKSKGLRHALGKMFIWCGEKLAP
ncbi:MAG: glycosyltransferase [Coriobacteriales bacterium]|nr:glycosyltransferase [Coriobacteriales bacterium]